MDKKKAYKVLRLNFGATRKDAKISYRNLAKTYHPDLSSNASNATDNDLRMKEINIAYRFLIPFLKVEDDAVLPQKNTTIQDDKRDFNKANDYPRAPFLSKVIQNVKHSFMAARRPNIKKGPQNEKRKPPVSKDVKKPSNIHFDEILSKYHGDKAGHKTMVKKPARRAKKFDSHTTYRRYTELRRKMKTNRANRNMNIGRVEKIAPIDPVKPVNNS